jgi:hypothetical protein
VYSLNLDDPCLEQLTTICSKFYFNIYLFLSVLNNGLVAGIIILCPCECICGDHILLCASCSNCDWIGDVHVKDSCMKSDDLAWPYFVLPLDNRRITQEVEFCYS